MLKVKNILQEKGNDVWTVPPKATAYRALEIMAGKNVGALLVVEGEGVVGIFSERDYARKVILMGKSSEETLVEELMTRDVYSITPDETIDECMGLMSATHIRHLPVLEENRLVGIVSIGDIVNAIFIEHKVKIKNLEDYITGRFYGP